MRPIGYPVKCLFIFIRFISDIYDHADAPSYRGVPRADGHRQHDARGRDAVHVAAHHQPRTGADGAGRRLCAVRTRAWPAAPDDGRAHAVRRRAARVCGARTRRGDGRTPARVSRRATVGNRAAGVFARDSPRRVPAFSRCACGGQRVGRDAGVAGARGVVDRPTLRPRADRARRRAGRHGAHAAARSR
ncbi:Transcriptional regulator [Burkholderia cenocepacia PC184]|nr:Transcriptional regulator [Burkholderia cenocepacia PC184]